MKLITEQFFDTIKFLKEDDAKTKEKSYYITGIFMQANTENRNRRVYPIEIIKREVDRYNEEYVNKNRALGELCHPSSPSVNLERTSHIIKELRLEGNDVIGKAKIIIDNPYGKIAKNLIDEGVPLGVSSRGLGSLKETNTGVKQVQSDFILAAIDIVADPSAPDAFVEGIMESVDWIYESGMWKAREVDAFKKEIRNVRGPNKKAIETKMLTTFNKLMTKLINN